MEFFVTNHLFSKNYMKFSEDYKSAEIMILLLNGQKFITPKN